MSTSVRRATPEDAAAIAAVHVAARRVGYQDFISTELLDTTFSNDFRALWQERLAADVPPAVYVAVRDGELVGYCMLVLPSSDRDSGGVVAELARMSVSPHAWRSGIGAALVDEVMTELRKDGWDAVSLWVLERNARARAFYSAFGFHTDGAEMTDPWSGQTQVRMRRALSDTLS